MNKFQELINAIGGLTSTTQIKILVSLAIILLLWLIQKAIQRMIWKQVQNVKTRYSWKRALSFSVAIIGIILTGSVWLPAFQQFGAFLGLLSAGIAIALKDPLTNIAGWFFIIFRQPFVVGDRVQIGQYSGDVIDIRLFQFTILEIGNWVQADQSTGRLVHLPNSKVFLEAQANYSAGFDYIWNEIPVLVTFESKWEKAKIILQEIVNKHAEHWSSTAAKEIFEASKNYMIYYKNLNPIVYTKVKDSGVQLTIRYLCNPRKRRGTENDIWEDILKQFELNKDINLAYPTTRFYNPDTQKGNEIL